MQGSGGSFYGIGIDRRTPFEGDNHSIHPCTFASTGYGSEVTHIGYTVEHNEKGIFALFKEKGYQVLRLLISYGRNKGHYPLMVLGGYPVEALYGDALNGDRRVLQCGKEFPAQVALQVSFDENFVYLLAGLYGFYHRPDAEYKVFTGYHSALLLVLVRRLLNRPIGLITSRGCKNREKARDYRPFGV
jgi:hypothetical protein